MPSPDEQKKIDALKAKEAQAAKDYANIEKQLRGSQAEWEKTMLAGGEKLAEPAWHLLTPRELSSDHGTQLTVQPDGSVLASGPSPDRTITFSSRMRISATSPDSSSKHSLTIP